MTPILLASASPRRRALLEAVGFSVTVCAVDVEEAAPESLAPDAWAEHVARVKANAVGGDAPLAVAADTVVWLDDGTRLGKPNDRAHANSMLQRLQGRPHSVTTGVAVVAFGEVVDSFFVTTRVVMRPVSQAEIDAYLDTDEPWDKAGSYAIQGLAGVFVERVDGDYANVVGLPVATLVQRLRCDGRIKTLPWEPQL